MKYKTGQTMTTNNQERKKFREICFNRDNNECLVPWCTEEAADAHHIVERELWYGGGYIPTNGVSVCEKHHKYAETNDIPPQSFWLWLSLNNSNINPQKFEQWDDAEWDIVTPESVDTWQVNKWGDEFETPPWEDLREYIKYQSTRHLLPLYWYDDKTVAQKRTEHDDTGLQTIDDFVDVPLVIMHKVDGGNMMLVNDQDNPVRARNGSSPKDTMELMYEDLFWRNEVYEKLPDRLQVFGEWLWAKHSIHYGCDCDDECDDVGPALTTLVDYDDERAYFQIFGVYDTDLNLWLSWPEVKQVAEKLAFPTVPVIYEEDDADEATFETEAEARRTLIKHARNVIDNGGEGIVVRSKFPYHYCEFGRRVGKYVRENHVDDDEKHWSKRNVKVNQL